MRVLRSREILPTVAVKTSQPPVKENMVFEPATPCKTSEFLGQSSNVTTPDSTAQKICGDLEPGLVAAGSSFVVAETGSLQRRSARLAAKVGSVNDYSETGESASRKRKSKVEGCRVDSELDETNLEGPELGLNSGVEKSGGVSKTNVDGWIFQNSDGYATELVTSKVGVRNGGVVSKLRQCRSAEALELEIVSDERCKRKLSMGMKSLDFEPENGEVDKRVLDLRSGRRVVKRGIEDHRSACIGKGDIEDRKRTRTSLRDNDLDETSSEASMEELENEHLKEGGFRREEKGKGKASCETLVNNGSVSVNYELDDRTDSHTVAVDLPKSTVPKVLVKDNGITITETGVKTRGRLSKEEKGKMKLGVKATSSTASNTVEPKLNNVDVSSVSDTSHASNEALPSRVQVRETDVTAQNARTVFRDRFRNVARRIASRFAHFSFRDEFGNHSSDGREIPLPEADNQVEDWPGPFSTAMKIIKDRATNKSGGRRGTTDKSEAVDLKWIPKKQESRKLQKQVPSLQEICLSVLSKNADAISSFDFVPDVLRHKICRSLCDGRKMDGHLLKLLLQGSPTELRLSDCSWLSEELFTEAFEGCNTSDLTVLQFDHCGNCMPDYTLYATLAQSPNSLPALTTISLKAAYRLSDAGLSMLVSSAPSLKSIDVSQCPLLTSEGIFCLANSLRLILRELYLDNCHGIDAMLILPSLLDLENLEVLSVAGVPTVCDDFICEFISARGHRMKELVLADCMELTDLSLKVIGDTCYELHAIDLMNLHKLTDVSIAHLANGCPGIQKMKFFRNAFSDEAIAAYLDLHGASLKDLSLNNVVKLSNHTALSLARNCRNLQSLDLSWCRNLSNEALGLIVDSCLSLKVLKLFGCTRVTDVFLNGHSNLQVKIVGIKMTSVLEHIDVPDFHLGPLRYSISTT